MELRINLQEHLHAGMELLTRGALEIRADDCPFVSPTLGGRLSHRGGRSLILLNQFHIAMPSQLATFGQFGFYPIFIGHLALNGFANHLIEF